MFTRSYLQVLRIKVLKRGLWYKALEKTDRAFYHLICSVVDRVESAILGRLVLNIVVKLKNALKGNFIRFMESQGVRKAWEVAAHGVTWGYLTARDWRCDSRFVRFHAMIEFNSPSRWNQW